MQFIKCRFSPIDSRHYTYANEGDPVAVGDMVKVADARDPAAWKRVEVVEVDVEKPTAFECKSILGKLTGDDVDAAIMHRAARSATT